MEIKIRDLSPRTIELIDEKAKKLGKSRNEYLKTLITKLSTEDEWLEEREQYSSLVKIITNVVNHNNDELHNNREILDEILVNIEEIKNNCFPQNEKKYELNFENEDKDKW